MNDKKNFYSTYESIFSKDISKQYYPRVNISRKHNKISMFRKRLRSLTDLDMHNIKFSASHFHRKLRKNRSCGKCLAETASFLGVCLRSAEVSLAAKLMDKE